ncbi:MAG: glycosyltransferase family 4 protein [Candidatus Eisenbacteria bacterium]|nr:glycosyltransferase family 4 protein [Candidatus Eisenbacteria bacterium]
MDRGPVAVSAPPSTDRLRVAAFSAIDLSLPQGHALHLRGILDALANRGHDVMLVTPRAAGPSVPTAFQRLEVRPLRWRFLYYWSFELLGGCRLFWSCAGGKRDLIYVRQDLYTIAPVIVSRLLRLPLVLEVNALLTEDPALGRSPIARRLVAASERVCLRNATTVIALSEQLGTTLARSRGIDAGRIRVVPIATHMPGPIDPEAVRGKMSVPPSTFVIGFAGNLAPVQGIETLIEAAALDRSGEVELWIIGQGREERRLREIAACDVGSSGATGGPEQRASGASASRAARVRFLGGLPREETDRLLVSCQILVAPYRWPDHDKVSGGGALSTKILTYLASDRPVLVSDIPWYSWIAEIGAGDLFAAGEAEDLARAIEKWRRQWIEAGRPLRDWPWKGPGPGRRRVEEDWTWERSAARLEAALVGSIPAQGTTSSTSSGRLRR